MTQGLLPFKYLESKKSKDFTGLSGLLLYLELFELIGLEKLINRNIQIKKGSQGWSDEQILQSLILLNLSGGDCVDDISKLEHDEGFCRILEHMELRGKGKRERHKIRKRWRRARENSIPSQSSIFRYLSAFHNQSEESKREEGKAFIPEQNGHLSGMQNINFELVEFFQKHHNQALATLDIDATLVKTSKSNALYAYKGGKSYQPINVWWAEQELVLHTEFRDGNVPAGHEVLRILKESLLQLPPGIEDVYLRSDSAAYQHELLRYCDLGEHERFGKIKFAVGSDVTDAIKESISTDNDIQWNPIYHEVKGKKVKSIKEWAEVCYVPNAIGHSKKGPEYRYIAIRELQEQKEFPEFESQLTFPFPTMEMDKKRYKLTAIVTNLHWEGEEIVHWYWKRSGKSEEVHGVMKEDFAGGKLPSCDFGENAAWWWIMVLAVNLNSIMKQLILQKEWKKKRMKALRYHIINIPAIVIRRKNKFKVYLAEKHPSLDIFINARKRIMELACLPAG
jgi:hypothetical protein